MAREESTENPSQFMVGFFTALVMIAVVLGGLELAFWLEATVRPAAAVVEWFTTPRFSIQDVFGVVFLVVIGYVVVASPGVFPRR